MNPVVHFEMPAENRKRMCDFYTKVFGWKTQQMGPEMGDYVLVTTTESDENGPKRPGAINGGFYPKTPDKKTAVPMVCIAVDDMTKAIKDVEKNGGKVLGKPVDIPGVGKYVCFNDSEGNCVSMLQPMMKK